MCFLDNRKSDGELSECWQQKKPMRERLPHESPDLYRCMVRRVKSAIFLNLKGICYKYTYIWLLCGAFFVWWKSEILRQEQVLRLLFPEQQIHNKIAQAGAWAYQHIKQNEEYKKVAWPCITKLQQVSIHYGFACSGIFLYFMVLYFSARCNALQCVKVFYSVLLHASSKLPRATASYNNCKCWVTNIVLAFGFQVSEPITAQSVWDKVLKMSYKDIADFLLPTSKCFWLILFIVIYK